MSGSFFNVLDYVYIALMFVSSLLGLANGFTRTLLSLAAWIASGFVAAAVTPHFYGIIEYRLFSPMVGKIVSYVTSYILSLILFIVLSRFASDAVKKSIFSGLDRALGLLFGLIRGLSIPAIVVAGLLLTGTSQDRYEMIEESQVSRLLYNCLDGLVPQIIGEKPKKIDVLKFREHLLQKKLQYQLPVSKIKKHS